MFQDQDRPEERTLQEGEFTLPEPERTIHEPRARPLSDPQVHTTWRDFEVLEELPALGGEADVFVIARKDQRFVLKLYRRGMEPKAMVLAKIKEVSDRFQEHVIQCFEYGRDDHTGRWYELLEYAPFGNLRDFLKGKGPFFDGAFLQKLITEINEGLRVLHENGVIHRDLKPTNILVRKDSPLDLVFGDFGVSSVVDSEVSRKQTSIRGTPLYSAPEAFTGVIGREVDYWSLGMILYELLTGAHPFTGLDATTIMYRLATQDIPIPKVSSEYQLLLKGLLTRNPRKRWGYEEVKRWCLGERDIPVFFGEEETRRSQPYTFMGKPYDTLEDLALAFLESATNYESAEAHLVKGIVKTWVSQTGGPAQAIWIDDILATSKDPEEMVTRFVYSLHKSLPLSLYGEEIVPEKLSGILSKELTQGLTEGEKKIVALLDSGRLREILTVYEELVGREEKGLREYLENYAKHVGKSQNTEALVRFLYMAHPERPFQGVDGSLCRTKEELAACLERNPEHYQKELQDPSAPFYLFLEARGFEEEAETFREFFKNVPPKGALNLIILSLQQPYFVFGQRRFTRPEELLECDREAKLQLIEELKDPYSKASLWLANFPELHKSLEKWRSLGHYNLVTFRYALGQGFDSGGEVVRNVAEFRELLKKRAKSLDLKEANYWLKNYMNASLNELIFSILETLDTEEDVRVLLSFALKNQEDSKMDVLATIERYDAFMKKWIDRNPNSSLARRYRERAALREARVKSIRVAIERDREWEKQRAQQPYDAILDLRQNEARRSEEYRRNRSASIGWFVACAFLGFLGLVAMGQKGQIGAMAFMFAFFGGIIGIVWGIWKLGVIAGLLGGATVGAILGAILGAIGAAVPYVPLILSVIFALFGVLCRREMKRALREVTQLTAEESAALSESLQRIDKHFEEKAKTEIARATLEILGMDDEELRKAN